VSQTLYLEAAHFEGSAPNSHLKPPRNKWTLGPEPRKSLLCPHEEVAMRKALQVHPRWAIVVLAATTVASTGALAAQALGNAKPERVAGLASKSISARADKVSGVDSTSQNCTFSTQYADMVDMSKNFTLEGNKKVVVMFSAQVSALAAVEIRLLVDGVVQSGPQPLLANDNPLRSHGFNFITDSLGSGSHTAKIQWRSTTQSVENCVFDRSLIVLYDG
jgi:hypothetical protein